MNLEHFWMTNKKFLSGDFAIAMKKIWPEIFETVKLFPEVDRIIWSLDALSDEDQMFGVLASPSDPAGLEQATFTVGFPETYHDLLARLKLSYEDEEKCDQLGLDVKEWLRLGLSKSWTSPAVLDFRKKLLKRRKLGVFSVVQVSHILRQNHPYLCGSRIAVVLNLDAKLYRFCDKYDCHGPRYNFVKKNGKIAQVDFSCLSEFPVISTEVVHDLAQFSKEIVSEHRPRKLYLNKKTEISKSNLGKLLKLFEIEKAVFITEAQSSKRCAAVEMQSEFGFGSGKWYEGSYFG